MAFTIDLTSSGATIGNDLPASGLRKSFLQQITVDFTETSNQLVNAGTMALMVIPAYVLVEEVFMLVHTADTDVTDVNVGSYTTAAVAVVADGFIDGLSLAATGIIRDVTGETYSPQTGTFGYMGTSDWVVTLVNQDADTINEAVVTFYAKCWDLRNAETE